MKSKPVTLEGWIALAAALRKFYAVPAIAGAVLAAMVQYQDRIPPQSLHRCASVQRDPRHDHRNQQRSAFSSVQPFTEANLSLYTVPPGKRRIINGVHVSMSAFGDGSARIFVYGSPGGTFAVSFAPNYPAPVDLDIP